MIQRSDSIARYHARLEKLHTRFTGDVDFFHGQRKTERVKLCVRQHWIRKVMIFMYFLVFTIVIPIVFLYTTSFFEISPRISKIINLMLSGYLLFAWLLTFIEFIKNELTILIITNERVVALFQANLFDQQISETSLSRIQEVTGHTQGLLGAVLGVGKLDIQTAGTEIPIVIKDVKSPHFAARKLPDIQKSDSIRQRITGFTKRGTDQFQSRSGDSFTAEELTAMRKPDQPSSKSKRPRRIDDGLN